MKIFILLLISFIPLFVLSQDNIIKKDGAEIRAKILAIEVDVVKYKRFDNIDGPTYSIEKSLIFMIQYENGTKDIFKIEEEVKPRENEVIEAQQNEVLKLKENIPNKIVLALGFSMEGSLAVFPYIFIDATQIIPKFEGKFGNQHIRGVVTLGTEIKAGFEVGGFFTFGMQGGYSLLYGPMAEATFGGRIPLNKKRSIMMNISQGAGIYFGGGYPVVEIHLIKIGLNFNLSRV